MGATDLELACEQMQKDLGVSREDAERILTRIEEGRIPLGETPEVVAERLVRVLAEERRMYREMLEEFDRWALLYADNRTRKPLLRLPGKQIARMRRGRLVQYKVLVDGRTVKV